MRCSLCNSPGTSFTKGFLSGHGTVYLCTACRELHRDELGSVDPPCACDPDALR